jgi:hypothetical protein
MGWNDDGKFLAFLVPMPFPRIDIHKTIGQSLEKELGAQTGSSIPFAPLGTYLKGTGMERSKILNKGLLLDLFDLGRIETGASHNVVQHRDLLVEDVVARFPDIPFFPENVLQVEIELSSGQ